MRVHNKNVIKIHTILDDLHELKLRSDISQQNSIHKIYLLLSSMLSKEIKEAIEIRKTIEKAIRCEECIGQLLLSADKKDVASVEIHNINNSLTAIVTWAKLDGETYLGYGKSIEVKSGISDSEVYDFATVVSSIIAIGKHDEYEEIVFNITEDGLTIKNIEEEK